MPLTGIRILDLTRIISGPYCTALLADMGAEVIKIEPPNDGDPVRHQGVVRHGMSWYFANYNRNKKSVTLDLYSDEGKHILTELIRRCDVIVENFRPGVMDKMGLSKNALKTLKPNIIHCSINGFGTSGPYRDRPSFDFIAQAMSGFMSLNGAPEDPPLRAGPPISDLMAGTNAALGIVAALFKREQTGDGDTLSVSLLNSMVGLLSFHASNYFANGQLPERTGNDHGIVAPYGLFKTLDGQVAIAPSNDAMYHKLLDALGLQALRDVAAFKTNADRMKNRSAIKAIIEDRTQHYDSTYWIERLNAHGVPCGQVKTMHDVFEDPQVIEQKMAIDVAHPNGEHIRMLACPIKFENSPVKQHRPAPSLGSDTHDVLLSIGLSREEINHLQRTGKI